jgi:hypothetical protein
MSGNEQQQKKGGGNAPAAKTAITPTREENYAEWYQQVVRSADLAENSPVRGCMVIKPWGYGLWENIQRYLDARFKETGHSNAYFPLLIPLSYLEKEAQHAEGFATECAVVTHHRLEAQKQLAMLGERKVDKVIACVGGGSNFGGIAFPYVREKIHGADIDIIAVEPASCPTLTRAPYAYDHGDVARMTTEMYLSDIVPAMKPSDAFAKMAHEEIERVEVDKLEGRVTAVLLTPDPPGIPLLVPGERFNETIVNYLKFTRNYNQSFPGFETDVHGLVVERENGVKKYFVDCVKM